MGIELPCKWDPNLCLNVSIFWKLHLTETDFQLKLKSLNTDFAQNTQLSFDGFKQNSATQLCINVVMVAVIFLPYCNPIFLSPPLQFLMYFETSLSTRKVPTKRVLSSSRDCLVLLNALAVFILLLDVYLSFPNWPVTKALALTWSLDHEADLIHKNGKVKGIDNAQYPIPLSKTCPNAHRLYKVIHTISAL